MIERTGARTGAALRAYLGLRWLAAPLGAPVLRRRLARGREDPARWREKLGHAGAARPEGPLVWMHAVGLGEVLALRGLIGAMAARRGDLSFLVTSTARTSALAFGAQTPARTCHQFLPLDLPGPVSRFLDNWRPDLGIWAEQDLWPGLVVQAARRGIPQALVNARMNTRAFARRQRVAGLYGELYARMALLAAQEAATAAHLAALGARDVVVTGSLKPAAPPLAVKAAALADLRARVAGRRVWLAAPSHAPDEALALAAWAPGDLLILAPRRPERREEIAQAVRAAGRSLAIRSAGQGPEAEVYLADTIGEMGLWYALSDAALIGGSFNAIEGHNPWEAAALGCAVIHGPHVANFAPDYAALAGASLQVRDAAGLRAALERADLGAMAARAERVRAEGQLAVAKLADDLLGLLA